MVKYLWEGLDARLASATPLYEDGDTPEGFSKGVKLNEAVARRVNDLQKKMIRILQGIQ